MVVGKAVGIFGSHGGRHAAKHGGRHGNRLVIAMVTGNVIVMVAGMLTSTHSDKLSGWCPIRREEGTEPTKLKLVDKLYFKIGV